MKFRLSPTLIYIILILFLLTLAGFVFIVAKSFVSKNMEIAKKQDEKIASKSSSKCQFNDDNFCTFFLKLQDVDKHYPGGLMLTVNSKSVYGVLTKNVWETDGKNNGRLTTYNQGNKVSETILIGKDVYILNTSNNTWDKRSFTSFSSDLNSDTNIVEVKKFVVSKIIEKLKPAKVTYVDQEKCGEDECYKYQIKLPGLSDTKEYVLFDNVNFLLHGTQSNAKDGYSESSTLQRSDVMITPPSK